MGLMLPASIFQDTALQAMPLGSALASPAFIFLAVIFALRLSANSSFNLINTRISFLAIGYSLFFIALNLFALFHFGFTAYGEYMIVRAIKIIILFGSLFYTGWLFTYFSVSYFSIWIRIAVAILVTGVFLDYIFHESWVRSWWIHYGINDERFILEGFDMRPRGLSYESSTLGMTIMTIGILTAGTSRSTANQWTWLILTSIGSGLSGSKAGIPVFVLSYLVGLALVNSARASLLLLICISVLGSLAIFSNDMLQSIINEKLILPFLLDLEQTTSVATRLTMALASFLTVMRYPLGVGLTGYVPGLVLHIEEATQLASNLVGLPLNFQEVARYLSQNDGANLGAKSFFLDAQIIFGIPFVLLWFAGHWKVLQRLRVRRDVLSICLMFMLFIALTFYIPGVNMYILAIGYGWILHRSFL